MPVYSYFRISKNVRLRPTANGLRVSVGPRAARLHLGGGYRPGVSTGAGPVTLYAPLTSSNSSLSSYDRELRQATKAEELEAMAQWWQRMLTVHLHDFPSVQPPQAPAAKQPDEALLLKEHLRQRRGGVPIWKLKMRRKAKSDAREGAAIEAAQLRERYEIERAELQRELDDEWRLLLANDEGAVIGALEAAFADNEAPAFPVNVSGATATILMLLDGEHAMPERVPHITPTGRPSSRKLNKTERSEMYMCWLASHALATVKEAFAEAPGLSAVALGVLRRQPPDPFGQTKVEVVYGGTFTREMVSRIKWDAPEAFDAIHYADDVLVNVKGRTKNLQALDLATRPDLRAIVDEVEGTLTDLDVGD